MKLTLDKNATDNRIVLAAIDDHSLNKIGRWPWTRTKIASVIDKLNTYGAKILAFDVFFSEPEVACNKVSPDIELVESITRFQSQTGRKVIIPFSVDIKYSDEIDEENYFKEVPDTLFNFILDTKQAQGSNLMPNIVAKKVYPIPELAAADIGISHIEANADSDGVFRHYPLVSNVDSIYFPSFALQTYQYFSGDKPIVEIPSPESAFVKTLKGKINLNYLGETKTRWLGGMNNFPMVTIYDLLNAKNDDPKMHNIFKDKIVFVASTAFGAHDLRNTPIDSALPGVYFHMNMTHMLLEGKFFQSEYESAKYSWIMMGIGTALIIIIMFMGNAVLDFLAVNIIIVTLLYVDTYYLIPKGYNVRLFFCFLSVLLCYSWSTFLHFYQSNKEKKKIKGTFSRYLAPSIVNDLLKNPEKLKLGGEKKNITVFFSDVRDFTSISEKLTPEQLTQCLNIYMTMMTDTLFEHKGTLDKYIGDAMVAYWGAPVELPNHAYWAVKGAIQMIEKLPAINEQFQKEGFPIFKHGIGLNTGECSVGNMGSNQIFSYTALGDNMNLGARLESLCKFYGVQLNISEYTKNAIPDELQKEFKFRTLDKVRVKGKENAVTIYEVLHPTHHLYQDDETIRLYEEAFKMYQTQKFEEAIKILTDLNHKYPADLSFDRILHICIDFRNVPPPPGWDGTYTHKSK
jgi:adenylate cyclase